jgi:hypothetical protein
MIPKSRPSPSLTAVSATFSISRYFRGCRRASQVRISAISRLGCHHCGREAAHGGISAILQFDFSHRDSAFMMGNHRAHKIGVGITREGYVHIAMHLGICGPVGPRSGSFSEPDTAPVDPCWVCCAFAESGVKTAVIASISANGLLLPIITILLQ